MNLAALIAIALTTHFLSKLRNPNQTARRPQNVLVITIDTLRADRLGCYGFGGVKTPHIDKLASQGLLFEQAIATAPFTLTSHASLFTGLYPYRHGVRDNVGYVLGEEQETLAEILSENGFSTAAFVSAYVLDGMWGVAQGFDLYYDDFRRFETTGFDESERPGAETISRWESWLDSEQRSPHFAWIHLFEPHIPYRPPEPYRSQYRGDPYLGEVAYSDALVGRILESLETRGLLDTTLIVLTSDHGEGLGDHAEKTHSFFIYNSTLRVPMILRGPGVSPGRITDRAVSTADILPTVLELVGIREREGLDGKSLLQAHSDRYVYSETLYPSLHYGWSPLFALQDRRYKFILAPRPEAFDLDRDPGETQSLSASSDASALREKLHRIVERAGEPAPARAPSPEQLARLSALGYTGSGGAPAKPSLADPKDKLEIFSRLEEGWEHLREGETEKALALAKDLTGRESTLADGFYLAGRAAFTLQDYKSAAESFGRARALVPISLVYLHATARALENAGALERAQVAYEEILKRQPRDVLALLRLGAMAFASGKLADAEARFKQVLSVDPRSAHAESNLGSIAASRGDLHAAERRFLRALELDPRVDNAHLNLGALYQDRGDFERAESEYRKEIEMNPKNVRAHRNLRLLLGKTGRREDAPQPLVR